MATAWTPQKLKVNFVPIWKKGESLEVRMIIYNDSRVWPFKKTKPYIQLHICCSVILQVSTFVA